MGNNGSHQHHREGPAPVPAPAPAPAPVPAKQEEPYKFVANRDKYESIEMVQDGLAKAGLESSNLIIGIY